MDSTRRKILKTGAAATAVAAASRVFAEQAGQGTAAASFYEKGAVRIHYQQSGSGFPLLLIAGAMRTKDPSALPVYQKFARKTAKATIRKKELQPA